MDPITIALGLANLAPIVAGWFGGSKAQENAQKVVDIASKVLPGTHPDQLIEALKANPDKLLEFQKAIAEQHAAVMTAVLADIQNARGTMVTLAGQGSKLAWGAAAVSLVVVIGNVCMGYWIFQDAIPPGNKDLAMLYAGSLLAALGGVIAFWTGSSYGSIQKTDALMRK